MSVDWINLVATFTLFQLVFLTVVIFNHKGGKRLSNLLLAGFMASNALLILHILLSRFGWSSATKLTAINSIGGSVYFLMMPFLFFYIRSLCYNTFQLKSIHILHAIPFVVFAFSAFIVHTFYNTPSTGSIEHRIHEIVLHSLILCYLIASAVALARYRMNLKDLYSSIERIDLQWCNLILVSFTVMWLLDVSNWVLNDVHLSSPSASYWMFISSLVINLSFTLVVTYKGLAQSATFSGIQAPPKYAASRLAASDLDEIMNRLDAVMKQQRPYLSPSLSMDELSDAVNVPAKNLSQAIHTRFNWNFYDFINSYRIEEIKSRLHDERYRNLTIVAIAFDSGFNSKSVFNAAFKKHTGMTPTEFKSRS